MKTVILRALCALLLLSMPLALGSCAGMIRDDDARVTAEEFFNALEVQNYDRARACLHPDSAVDVVRFVEDAAESLGIDFASGVTVESVTVTKNAVYTGFERSTHKTLSVSLLVGGIARKAEVRLLKNGAGYGIHQITWLGD